MKNDKSGFSGFLKDWSVPKQLDHSKEEILRKEVVIVIKNVEAQAFGN
ncbi:MAG: hypothetical protein ABFD50_21620 [Smithella sp.]